MRMKRCPLCGQPVPELLYDLHCSVDDLIIGRMKRDFPGWSEAAGACGPCLERYKGMAGRGASFTSAAITSVWIPS